MWYFSLVFVIKLGGSIIEIFSVTLQKTEKDYRISSFKRGGVYLVLGFLGAAFISKIKIEEDEIMCQFKAIRYFLNHAV